MNSRYRAALDALAARTKTPLPSLAVSFAILHEVTAIVPLVGLFYGARTFGIGEQLVSAAAHESATGSDSVMEKFREWIHEGDLWAERVGVRYGWFGYEKGQPKRDLTVPSSTSEKIAGDVANAVFAYAAAKLLLPARIGLSLYLAPGFSRKAVEPTRQFMMRLFRRS